MTTVLIAGGGTGGHVYPMIAVGDAILRERPEARVVYVGTGRGIETRVCGQRGDTLELLDVLPLRGGGVRGAIRGSWRALMTLSHARRLVKRLAPDVVFSVGGYAAGPVTLAARLSGIPVTLLEPNAVLGFTNRVLSRLVRRAYVAFPETAAGLPGGVARYTGVPLRQRFMPLPLVDRARPQVLVMGGSQGAQALNETLPHAFAACRSSIDFDIVHQTGRDKDADVRARYRRLGIDATIVTFIDDVAAALADADLVIERSGAGSLAELCAIGRPAILVPYPHAADDHQRHNAESLARAGAAVCVTQRDASVERLATELGRLLGDRAVLAEMARAASERGRPDAAAVVARDLLALADRADEQQPQRPRSPAHRTSIEMSRLEVQP